jgi:hypothetical protein
VAPRDDLIREIEAGKDGNGYNYLNGATSRSLHTARTITVILSHTPSSIVLPN